MKKYILLLLFLPAWMTGEAQGLRPKERKVVQPPVDKKKFQLFLLVGQSNMAGRGYLEAVDTVPHARVLRLNKEGEWEEAKDPIHFDKPVAGVGPGSEFGKVMADADTSVVIGLIPCAVGGSGIDYWQQGAYYPATKTNPYDDAILRAKKAMQNGTLAGIIWHQGEADSKPAACLVYEEKLKALIANFRKDLEVPMLPFVAGQLPDFQIYKQDSAGHRTVNASAIKVNKAIADVKKSVRNYSFVAADSTQHRGDVLHFNAASARLMGRRYAREMKLLYAAPNKSLKDKPNIVIIMADDMGYSDLGCYGGEAHTPNIDRLAKNGLRFRTFYNAARCCPSRASLLTGVYPHEAGMGGMVSDVESTPKKGPYQGFLNEKTVTIAEALKLAGYTTYMSGKWHVGEKREHWPRQRGFDRYFGLISGASSYFELVEEPRVRQMAHDDTPWTPPADGFYMTDAISDTAVNFIEQHENAHAEQPFFLYLAYTAPHWPLHAPDQDIKRYAGVYDSGWDELRQRRFERMQQMGIIDGRHELSPRTAKIPAWDTISNKSEWASRMEVYAAMIDRMDQGVGRVLSALERQGELENTLIIFLSDNGGCAENIDGRKLNKEGTRVGQRGSYLAYDEPWANVSNTPYRKYKSWTHEGGVIAPCIVHWPAGIKRSGQFTNAVGDIKDIMATCLDLAETKYPHRYHGHQLVIPEGKSWRPLFDRELVEERTLFWEHFGKKAVRSGQWKLVSGGKDKRWELYNLAKDPEELTNVSGQHIELVEKLKEEYSAWAKKVGAK